VTAELEAQVCVIGSGAGGCAAASELQRGGFDTLLLEDGPHHDPASFDQRESTMMSRLYADGGLRTTTNQAVGIISGRGLGGSTTHNTGLAVPPPIAVLEAWARVGGLPAPVEDVVGCADEVMTRLGARSVDADEINANNRLLATGAERLGVSSVVAQHNRARCSGCGYCMIGCAYNLKRNALFAWLEDGVRAGLAVRTGARVEHIRETARGCVVRGRGFQVRCDQVVVAASAIGTPMLLRNSGLGSSRRIGRTLRLHPFAPVAAVFDDPVIAWRGVPQSVLVTGGARFLDGGRGGFILMAGAAGPGAMAAFVSGHGREVTDVMRAYPRLAAAGVLLHDEGCGTVSAGRGGRPRIRYWPDRHDRNGIRDGIRLLARIWLAAGARRVLLPFRQLREVASEAEVSRLDGVAFRPHDVSLNSVHPQGSVSMGADPAAAVRPDGRLRGTRRVWVADGSLFPGSVGVPPQVAIMTFGALVGRSMVAEMKS